MSTNDSNGATPSQASLWGIPLPSDLVDMIVEYLDIPNIDFLSRVTKAYNSYFLRTLFKRLKRIPLNEEKYEGSVLMYAARTGNLPMLRLVVVD
ncbi:hypothetical protein PG994_013432 [Apiospora phragmitis]|uniref:F-box domain-containing protein n=1 Tax=Apiospora phragmitis TaxID=2905665 RepID=A0ABR1TAU8_9PEZI